MSDWSISKRITVLSTLLVGGLLLVAALGLTATILMSRAFQDYGDMSRESRVIAAMQLDALEARSDELHFRLDRDPADAESFTENMREVADLHEDLSAYPSPLPDARERLAASASGFETYAAGFDDAIRLEEAFATSADRAREAGQSVRQRLTAVMEQARLTGNVDLLAGTATAQQHLILSRLYLERFFLSSLPADREDSVRQLDLATAALDRLATALSGATTSEVAALRTGLSDFGSAADEAEAGLLARDAARSALDATGTDLLGQLETIADSVLVSQSALAERNADFARWVIGLLIAVSLVAAAGAAFAAKTASGRIRDSIAASVGEMQELAGGNLSVTITGADRTHELGQMARALEVFRDNAVAAREAEERQKEQERLQRDRDAERDRREAEAAEAQRRQAEEDRKDVIRRLQASIGAVVDGAAAGDFSRRITETFAEPEFGRMAEAVNRLMSNVDMGVREVARVMSNVAAGDLTERVTGNYAGLFAELQASVNESLSTLTRVIDDIAAGCEAVTAQAGQVTDQSIELARRAEQQAASLEETSAAMEEISATARSSAEGAASANEFATRATGRVDEAGRVVAAAVGAMGDIRAASTRIGEIVAVIEGIAFQTNLLALNASVEAARAGTAGKGFAVVATEVRALAQRSSAASQDIKSLIDESAAQVNRGVDLVEETGVTLKEIVEGVRQMAGSLGELVTAGREQAAGVQEVTTAIAQLDTITQRNAALADQGRDLAGDLKSRAEAMEGLVASFRTGSRRSALEVASSFADDDWQAA
jgi:methyl-accepting chemotaxis protein